MLGGFAYGRNCHSKPLGNNFLFVRVLASRTSLVGLLARGIVTQSRLVTFSARRRPHLALQDGVPPRYACLACLLGGFDDMEMSLKTAW